GRGLAVRIESVVDDVHVLDRRGQVAPSHPVTVVGGGGDRLGAGDGHLRGGQQLADLDSESAGEAHGIGDRGILLSAFALRQRGTRQARPDGARGRGGVVELAPRTDAGTEDAGPEIFFLRHWSIIDYS